MILSPDPESIAVIAGPTASGKTELTVRLQEQYRGLHIISADAFTVYRGMDIGTGKPSPEIRRMMRHHLIDICDPTESYTAGRYARDAEVAITEVLEQKGRPVVCGGSGLYLAALIEGLHELPRADDELRALSLSRDELLARLALSDSEAASELRDAPSQRLTRAIEIVEGTCMALSVVRKVPKTAPRFRFHVHIQAPPRDQLYRQINDRVDRMVAEGLIDEVLSLREKGITPEMVSQKAIGYREAHQFLDGAIPQEEMVRLIKRNTRRYAKRQETWIRNRFRCQAIASLHGMQ